MTFYLRLALVVAVIAFAPIGSISSLGVYDVGISSAQAAIVTCGNKPKVDTTSFPGQVCYYRGGNDGECTFCDIMTMAQSIVNFLVATVVLVAALLFVNAGVLYISASASPGNVSRAHKIFINTVIGLVITLAAWLLIDVVMKTLMDDTATVNGTLLGPWNDIICKNALSEPYCITIRDGSPGLPTGPAVGSGSGGSGSGSGGAQCKPQDPYCGVAALEAAGFTTKQANVMSCIAITESSGKPATPPHNVTNPGSPSSACGLFQVTKTTWDSYPVSGCSPHNPSCMRGDCNTQVALKLVQKNGYKDWTCPGCNSKAQDCVNKYGG